MPQIILYKWKIIFSGSLLHKTPTPCVEVSKRDLLQILREFRELSLTTLALATHSADKTRWRDAEIFYKTSKLSYIFF